MNANGFKSRESGFHTIIDPLSEDLGGRIFEALNFVKVVVIEYFMQRLPGVSDLREVNEHAGTGIDLSLDDDVDLVAMSVQAGAFVSQRDEGEPMSGFEAKRFRQRCCCHETS